MKEGQNIPQATPHQRQMYASRPVRDDPRRPYKALISTVGTFVAAFVMAWVADTDPFTAKEAGAAFVGALTLSGLTGGVTFAVKNPKRRR